MVQTNSGEHFYSGNMGKTRQLGDLVNIIGTDGAGSVILPTLPTVPSIEMVVFNPDHTISTQPINITTTLSALTDVSLISPVPGQVLTFDGLKWINANATGGSGNLPVGGTAGQILAKIDATNYNTTWIDNFTSQVKHEVKLSETLAKGTPVYVSSGTGGSGTNMIVSAASNTSEVTSSKTMGLLQSGGVTNDFVYVITEGLLAGLDTSAATTVGDPVWLGPSGTLLYGVGNKPVAPIHMVFIGIVTRIQSNNGEIFVKVQNGFEIEELHNVLFTSKADKDLMYYDNNASLWKNAQLSTILGYTPISGTGVAGQVAYWNGTTAMAGSSNLVWDNTTGRLGIGTSSPASKLNVINTTASEFIATFRASGTPNPAINIEDGDITIPNYSAVGFVPSLTSNSVGFISSSSGAAGGLAFSGFTNTTGGNPLYFQGFSGKTTGNTGAIVTFLAAKHNGTTNATVLASNEIPFEFVNWSSTLLRIYGNGNMVLQNGGTFTDGGQRLQVIGDAFIKGSGNTSATTAFTVQNSSSSDIFRVQNDGATIFSQGSYFLTDTNLIVDRTTTDGISMRFRIGSGGNVGGLIITHLGSHTKTSGTSKALSIEHNFAPTSGTAQFTGINFAPTINQTGGANGITRGLYVAPTLTAAADFRAIETTAGNVLFGSNFFWDNTNARLGIGTNSPARGLDIKSSVIFTANVGSYSTVLHVENTGNASIANKNVAIFVGARGSSSILADNTNIGIWQKSNIVNNYANIIFYNANGTDSTFFGTEYLDHGGTPSANLYFGTNSSGTQSVKAKIFHTGNFMLQNGGTFTDNGQRLQVNGDAAIISATSTGITTTTNVHTFAVANIKAVHYDYYIQNTVNGGWRTGVVMAVTNGTNVEFTDTATNDLTATTAGLTWSVSVISTNIVLTATITSGTWNIKVGTRML